MEYMQPIGADPGDAYVDANPGAGIEGSAVPAAAIEHPQREIVNAIAAAGLEPDSGDLTQLTAAIQAMIDAAGTALGSPVGTVVSTIRTTAPAGWLMMDGGTIGNASSGADQASDEYEALFTLLWESMADAQAPVSGGRGASAAADWAADKTLTMPDVRGRTIIGGGTGGGLTARIHGDTDGEEDHQLTSSEMPAHSHSVQPPAAVSHSGEGQTTSGTGAGQTINTYNTNSSGGNLAHNNMQPWLALNWIVRW